MLPGSVLVIATILNCCEAAAERYLSVKPPARIVVVPRPRKLVFWDLTAAGGCDQLPDIPSPDRSLFIR